MIDTNVATVVVSGSCRAAARRGTFSDPKSFYGGSTKPTQLFQYTFLKANRSIYRCATDAAFFLNTSVVCFPLDTCGPDEPAVCRSRCCCSTSVWSKCSRWRRSPRAWLCFCPLSSSSSRRWSLRAESIANCDRDTY